MQIPGTAALTRRTYIQTAMAGLAGYSSVVGRRAGAAGDRPGRASDPRRGHGPRDPHAGGLARPSQAGGVEYHRAAPPQLAPETPGVRPGGTGPGLPRSLQGPRTPRRVRLPRDERPGPPRAVRQGPVPVSHGRGRGCTADRNFCVHSATAMRSAVEKALVFARALRSTTGRYYYWSDGCAAWCRCRRCRELSDSDQSLLVENAIVKALRSEEPVAQVAHLACHASMPPPKAIKPEAGVFLQFARSDDATTSHTRGRGARTRWTASGISSGTWRCSPRRRRRRWSIGWTSRSSARQEVTPAVGRGSVPVRRRDLPGAGDPARQEFRQRSRCGVCQCARRADFPGGRRRGPGGIARSLSRSLQGRALAAGRGLRSRSARPRRASARRRGGRRAWSSSPTRGWPSSGPSPACRR